MCIRELLQPVLNTALTRAVANSSSARPRSATHTSVLTVLRQSQMLVNTTVVSQPSAQAGGRHRSTSLHDTTANRLSPAGLHTKTTEGQDTVCKACHHTLRGGLQMAAAIASKLDQNRLHRLPH